MTGLDSWLKQATQRLSKDSAAQVRTEIQEHFEMARETAMSGGATADEADLLAVTALGDAKAANCQYRKVLLTSAEARLLRESKWEARGVCSRRWVKWLLLAIPVAALLAAGALLLTGAIALARVVFAGGLGMSVLLAAPFLPIYTPARGRIYRRVKWAALLGMFVLAFGPPTPKWSWLITPCLWPMVWIEWTRVSIRRKLRVADWPKTLYL